MTWGLVAKLVVLGGVFTLYACALASVVIGPRTERQVDGDRQ